eukprot:5051299-Amphidinium_carterae.1
MDGVAQTRRARTSTIVTLCCPMVPHAWASTAGLSIGVLWSPSTPDGARCRIGWLAASFTQPHL